MQEYVALGTDMLEGSQSQFREVEWHKDLLHQLWSPEDVQTWVTAFTECVSESQKALEAILTAAKSQGQVSSNRQRTAQQPSR